MCSFVIEIAMNVERAVLLVNTIPMLGIIFDNVEKVIAVAEPKKNFSFNK